MTVRRHLDAAAAVWLARVDPALRLLPDALRSSTTPAYELHDVRWIPDTGCSLSYRVRTRGGPSRFVAVEVHPDGWSSHDQNADPDLPGLRSASDAGTVRGLVASVLDRTVGECRIEPVRYRPRSRCVLRCEVETDGGLRTLYAKVLAPRAFADVMQGAVALARSRDAARLTPRLEATWPHLQTLVTSAAPGRSVSSVLGDPRVPAARRARLAHRLGSLLGDFHDIGDVSAPRWAATDQVAGIRLSLAAASSANPAVGARVAALLDRLEELTPAEDDEVLSHGGFRAGQVVVGGDDQLFLLDTDGLSRAPRARDLGAVLAHLMWQRVREPGQRLALRAAEKALLMGYERRAGTLQPAALDWWRAGGLLQVAARRYSRLETAAWPLVPALLDAAAELVDTLESQGSAGGTDLLDLGRMSALLRPALGGPAAPAPTLEVDSADVMSTSTGRRAVVRYGLRGQDGATAVTIVGKAFTESPRARLLYEHLLLLHQGPFGEGPTRVPEPIGMLAEQRLVLYRHCAGERLDRITDPTRAEQGVRLAAQWLARLHSSGVRLPRTFSLGQEERSTRSWAALIGRTDSDLASRSRLLASGWLEAARAAAVEVQVPIHKDFHAGHVLVGQEVYVIDLDEARQGDPAFDVAHFCTYLQTVHGGPRTGHTGGAALRAAFLEEYTEATGWNDQGTFGPFCAYAWLKIAKQYARGSGPFRSVPVAERRAAAARAVVEGERCLNG